MQYLRRKSGTHCNAQKACQARDRTLGVERCRDDVEVVWHAACSSWLALLMPSSAAQAEAWSACRTQGVMCVSLVAMPRTEEGAGGKESISQTASQTNTCVRLRAKHTVPRAIEEGGGRG